MTLRTPLENFIRALDSDFDLTHEAKRIKKLGAPDFTAYRSGINIGYIEAKDLGKNLDEEIIGDQLKRYRESIDNIILTDYRRFILIRGSQTIFDQSLFSQADLSDPKSRIHENKIDEFVQLIDTFFGYSQPTIRSAKILAEELAKKTKLLKDLASEQLEEDRLSVEQGKSPSPLYDFFETLEELIKDILIEDCADAYAQTITYGLFLAKINEKGALDRNTAATHIPRNIQIIRKIFQNIAGDSLPSNVSWIVDDLIRILNASATEEILSEIDFRGKKDRDPFTFFYEDFLEFYEPEKKKHLGVYYTPRPVVSFIVKSVNQTLKDVFDKPMGFAEEGLTVLDPAAGTGTFLWLTYLSTLVELKSQGLGGLIPKKIKNHILQDFYGFELLITPYIIAHLKLTAVLRRWFYEFGDEDRVQVYLTNTLEPQETHTHMPFFRELTEESEAADELKLKTPIMVILGNPPYRGLSANKGKWINSLLKDGYVRPDGGQDKGYYCVDDEPLGEKNPKWLQDDYVKFIRFDQWKIDSAGEGIIGIITNHSYLDNPTFRGMRQSLLNSFDRIYILNLHGNSQRKEKAPDGSKDENVFNIRQGVAIAFFIKKAGLGQSRLFYADLYGTRDYKYDWLDRNEANSVAWEELSPKSPNYFFTPIDTSLEKEYTKFWKITEIFPTHSVGIVTARDGLTINETPEKMWNTVSTLTSLKPETARNQFLLGKDSEDWKITLAQNDLLEGGLDAEKIIPILYRPYDVRYTYYTGRSGGFLCRPRPEVMAHFVNGDNLGLVTVRQIAEDTIFNHVLVTNAIIDARLTISNRGMAYVFPLWIYTDEGNDKQRSLHETQREEPTTSRKTPNFSEPFKTFIAERYPNQEVTPEAIFGYIYAILNSPTYREIYNEFLRKDFPRITFVEDYDLFLSMSELGTKLVDLHLMRTKPKATTTFDVQGSNVVKSVKYKDERAYINESQFFGGISDDVWTFYIGGYQVLDKWLKSRKGRELGSSEIEHFLQIVEVIKKTIEYMKEIDGITHFV